ncbi:glycosyltransferase [Hymenobacter sp. HMF4947]|uniref:Glycosyltransferase n=1 Tax=Hymenobacter ginkgonis TaxID=2682976 RepID=A0A7K1TG05_9BACT|nr:glycosyltransferase [Hymenobacter ginkgonis]MVN77242.1 glycosyltransferase [Hymenobacter ginkgonis]
MATILYLGDSHPSSTSAHRARALERLGHTVNVCDLNKVIAQSKGFRYLEPLHYRTGYRFLQPQVTRLVKHLVATTPRPDVVWVNSGELVGPRSLELLKQLGCPLVLYNNDDPTGGRDGRRFDTLLKSLSYYDLCAVMREINVPEFRAKGAKNVIHVRMSYDEVVHQPFTHASDIPAIYKSEVVFIGTWMRYEKRDEFLLALLEQGIPLTIWGSRWSKSPHWAALQAVHKGDALSGRDYVAAIQGAKICLGLLSKGNRDEHTQRSQEVPFAGGLLCAERTAEHQEMYEEGVEAAFWADAAECAQVCKKLLQDDDAREKMRLAGMQRVRAMQAGNEDVCRRILNTIHIY